MFCIRLNFYVHLKGSETCRLFLNGIDDEWIDCETNETEINDRCDAFCLLNFENPRVTKNYFGFILTAYGRPFVNSLYNKILKPIKCTAYVYYARY